jgi:hypothetical protein
MMSCLTKSFKVAEFVDKMCSSAETNYQTTLDEKHHEKIHFTCLEEGQQIPKE